MKNIGKISIPHYNLVRPDLGKETTDLINEVIRQTERILVVVEEQDEKNNEYCIENLEKPSLYDIIIDKLLLENKKVVIPHKKFSVLVRQAYIKKENYDIVIFRLKGNNKELTDTFRIFYYNNFIITDERPLIHSFFSVISDEDILSLHSRIERRSYTCSPIKKTNGNSNFYESKLPGKIINIFVEHIPDPLVDEYKFYKGKLLNIIENKQNSKLLSLKNKVIQLEKITFKYSLFCLKKEFSGVKHTKPSIFTENDNDILVDRFLTINDYKFNRTLKIIKNNSECNFYISTKNVILIDYLKAQSEQTNKILMHGFDNELTTINNILIIYDNEDVNFVETYFKRIYIFHSGDKNQIPVKIEDINKFNLRTDDRIKELRDYIKMKPQSEFLIEESGACIDFDYSFTIILNFFYLLKNVLKDEDLLIKQVLVESEYKERETLYCCRIILPIIHEDFVHLSVNYSDFRLNKTDARKSASMSIIRYFYQNGFMDKHLCPTFDKFVVKNKLYYSLILKAYGISVVRKKGEDDNTFSFKETQKILEEDINLCLDTFYIHVETFGVSNKELKMIISNIKDTFYEDKIMNKNTMYNKAKQLFFKEYSVDIEAKELEDCDNEDTYIERKQPSSLSKYPKIFFLYKFRSLDGTKYKNELGICAGESFKGKVVYQDTEIEFLRVKRFDDNEIRCLLFFQIILFTINFRKIKELLSTPKDYCYFFVPIKDDNIDMEYILKFCPNKFLIGNVYECLKAIDLEKLSDDERFIINQDVSEFDDTFSDLSRIIKYHNDKTENVNADIKENCKNLTRLTNISHEENQTIIDNITSKVTSDNELSKDIENDVCLKISYDISDNSSILNVKNNENVFKTTKDHINKTLIDQNADDHIKQGNIDIDKNNIDIYKKIKLLKENILYNPFNKIFYTFGRLTEKKITDIEIFNKQEKSYLDYFEEKYGTELLMKEGENLIFEGKIFDGKQSKTLNILSSEIIQITNIKKGFSDNFKKAKKYLYAFESASIAHEFNEKLGLGLDVQTMIHCLASKDGEYENYERLEFLGDTVLKFVASKYIFLTKTDKLGVCVTRKDSLISNNSLFIVSKKLDIPKYFTFLKWSENLFQPPNILNFIENMENKNTKETFKNYIDYFSSRKVFTSNNITFQKKKSKKDPENITGTKTYADIVEAIIGALYIHKGLDKSEEFIHSSGITKIENHIEDDNNDLKSLNSIKDLSIYVENHKEISQNVLEKNFDANGKDTIKSKEEGEILNNSLGSEYKKENQCVISVGNNTNKKRSRRKKKSKLNKGIENNDLILKTSENEFNEQIDDHNYNDIEKITNDYKNHMNEEDPESNQIYKNILNKNNVSHSQYNTYINNIENETMKEMKIYKKILTKDEIEGIEKKIGYKFKYPGLIEKAMIHPSSHCNVLGSIHFNKLELLGDCVLDLVITEYIYFLYTTAEPEEMHFHRKSLVNNFSLARVLFEMELDIYLHIGFETDHIEKVKESLKKDGNTVNKAFGDVLESIFGAVLVDCGFSYEKFKNFFMVKMFDFFKRCIDSTR